MGSKGSVRKMIQSLKEIVNCSDSEIYTMLVECHMDPNETVIRLISQDAFQEVKSKRDKKKRDTKDQAESSRRGIPNRGARNSAKYSYNTARGGGNKFNSDETRFAQRGKGARNHWADSSSAPNSDPKNAEVKEAAPTGPTGAASSSLLPAPAYQSAWAKANPGKKTMAEIVKMGKPLHQKKVSVPRSSETQERGSKAPLKDEGSSTEKQESGSKAPLKDGGSSLEKKESGSKAPLKDEGSSFEMQDVSDPVPSLLKPFAEPKTHADQVSEPQHVDESEMDDEVLKTKTNQVAFHPDLDQVAQLSHLRFGSFGLIGSGRASSRFNYNLEDTQETEEDSSFRQHDTNFYGGEEELRYNATDEQTSYQIDSTARNYHASSDSEREAAHHEEPPQKDPYMQNLDRFFTNVMDLRDESISPPGGGQQAAALYQHPALHPYFNQHGMPLGHHGNFICDPFMPHGYMHPGFQQGFPVGNHQAPLVVVIPPSASSLQQQQNENTFAWQLPHMRVAPSGEVYICSVNPNMQPPGFVQAQQLHQQQLSQQALMSLDQLHHQHQHQHHQQSAGEASRQTQEQLWPNNN
ncbi:hypothetical protein HID58_080493 [Brassica napus]|uniref:GBF-interacting protein 1 N-terminal domain-containing protein n=2 Tax=Brassica napus TaxID=3708 RepID=A0ABQ7Y524_BRANA|nr:GBF-interacting protein 1-like [Brassica napus]KAH0863282.1 hypothetical protein HID58_080493 [Brassica napus]CDY08888.1 BnaC08g11180D [Brassica napus]